MRMKIWYLGIKWPFRPELARFTVSGITWRTGFVATEVNPDTAERDLKIPHPIRELMGHKDMGVYVELAKGGTLSVGQTGGMLS